MGFPGGSAIKNLPAMQETWVLSLGWEGPLDKGMATHSHGERNLKNPMDRGAWQATVHRVAKSQTRLKQLSPFILNTLIFLNDCRKGISCLKPKHYRKYESREVNILIYLCLCPWNHNMRVKFWLSLLNISSGQTEQRTQWGQSEALPGNALRCTRLCSALYCPERCCPAALIESRESDWQPKPWNSFQ